MRLVPGEEIKKWPALKGAEYQAASGGGFPRHAGKADSDPGNHGGLHSRDSTDAGHPGGTPVGGQRLRQQ